MFGEFKDSGVGAELLVITNQNQVLASGSQRSNNVRLENLSGFLYNRYSRFQSLQELAELCRAYMKIIKK